MQSQFDTQRMSVIQRAAADLATAQNRESLLSQQYVGAKDEWDNVNAKSTDYRRIKNEADTDRSVYTGPGAKDPGSRH